MVQGREMDCADFDGAFFLASMRGCGIAWLRIGLVPVAVESRV